MVAVRWPRPAKDSSSGAVGRKGVTTRDRPGPEIRGGRDADGCGVVRRDRLPEATGESAPAVVADSRETPEVRAGTHHSTRPTPCAPTVHFGSTLRA